MNKKEKAARNVLIGGCIASVIAGIVLWLTLSLSTGLIVAGAGLVASGLLASFLLKSASRGGKPEETKLVDRKVIEEAAKKVRKTSPKSMKKEMRDLTTQCERMLQKAELLDKTLNEQFGSSVTTKARFASIINGVYTLYAQNVNDIIHRVEIFDEDGYEQLHRNHEQYTDAIKPYAEQMDAVRKEIAENEEILSRIDRLLAELNKLSGSDASLKTLPEMEELSDLIAQTPLYRQQN
ncbi:hypothetical protein [Allobaculum fili]|uniref:hypothetical protein n=3 Tax=Erysipelotrichaceae TaxID=128827 RepID=UPI001E616D6C|nr:hypothetical protein [Allobaculum fili]